MNEQKFFKYIPGIYLNLTPTLREQIDVLEKISGVPALIKNGKLSIYVGKILSYSLNKEEHISGKLIWSLTTENRYYISKDLKRPELLEIVVSSTQIPYRGVIYNNKTYWTDDMELLSELEQSVKALVNIQDIIFTLIGEK
jgi:hypothetical protein